MSNIDPMLMRQIIMDHYDYPRNKELTKDNGYMSRHMASDSCIDDITVQTKISDGKIAVEEVQDSVENVLIQCGYGDVAKAYILYRKQREAHPV